MKNGSDNGVALLCLALLLIMLMLFCTGALVHYITNDVQGQGVLGGMDDRLDPKRIRSSIGMGYDNNVVLNEPTNIADEIGVAASHSIVW